MIKYDLAGQTALVTGAASGIGLATATMLARSGATVAMNFLPDDPRGPQEVAALRDRGLAAIEAPGSVGIVDEALPMVESAINRLGGLNLLVNNAATPGVGITRPIEPRRLDLIDDALWETQLQTNLIGVFRCSKAAAPALTEAGGAIVTVSSLAGIDGAGSSLVYAAMKAAVINLTKNLARALAPAVRVNSVAPGSVQTSWQVKWGEERNQAEVERALLKRRCTGDDIAEVILFLGFGAAMITGQTVIVDGGKSV
jgi:3-oxoacyl-[acyl-carrier protein] reductase